MEYESHYYAAGYSPENDPYVMENGVLINKLGLTDTQTLNVVELRIASLEVNRILKELPPATFDLAYHRQLHYQIFQLVYPWAGELRKVDIGKGDTLFLPHSQIEQAADQLFADLAAALQRTGLGIGDDVMELVGRRGRTAQSIRTVVRAAATRDEAEVDVDFVD